MLNMSLYLRDTEEFKDTGGTPKTAGGARPQGGSSETETALPQLWGSGVV